MSRVIHIALVIGLSGLATIVGAVEPDVQEQLDMLKRQLIQQQRMIEEMQRQLDEQKEINRRMVRESEAIRQQAEEDVESIAREAEEEVESIVLEAEATVESVASGADSDDGPPAEGIDVSKETDRIADTQDKYIRVKDTNTVLTISGFIRASAIHDFDKIASPTKFSPRYIVVNGEPRGQPNSQTTLTANGSRFIIGSTTPTVKGKLNTFFSWDFMGNTTSSDEDLRLRQAWGELDDFAFGGDLRVGRSWSTWTDLRALPESVNFSGPNGSQQRRQALVRWSRDFSDRYSLRVALEDPEYDIDNGGSESGWPDTVAALNWNNDWGRLRPAVVGRQIRGDDPNGGSDTAFGWGLQLAGDVKLPLLGEKDRFQFQTVYGSGISHFNVERGFADAWFDDDGDLRTLDSFQGYGALQHWWTESVRSNAIFGWVDVDNRSEQSDDSLDRTLYASINLIWNPVREMSMGFEYLWGERKNHNNDDATANRIQATTKVQF